MVQLKVKVFQDYTLNDPFEFSEAFHNKRSGGVYPFFLSSKKEENVIKRREFAGISPEMA